MVEREFKSIFFHTGIEGYAYKRNLPLKRRAGMVNPYEKPKEGGVVEKKETILRGDNK